MRGATSRAALKRKAAGLEPAPDAQRSAAGAKGAAKRYGRRLNHGGGAKVAGGSLRPAEVSRFVAQVTQNQAVARLQAVALSVENAPAIVNRLCKIAMGEVIGSRVSDEITAGRTVLEIARVMGPMADGGAKKGADAPLTEHETESLRALVGALESIKRQPGQQAVTVEGEAERVQPAQREPGATDGAADPDSPLESTACDGSGPDYHTGMRPAQLADSGSAPIDAGGRADVPSAAAAGAGTPGEGADARTQNHRGALSPKFPPLE